MTEKELPLVSVVTPFYNTAEYLRECIESVLKQTYENFEYVLVDNRSTDGSAEIAKEFVRQDHRIRLVSNERFLTQVENYNHALRQINSESKYCKLVQADDWIFPNCVKEMVAVAETGENVSLVSAYSLFELLPPDGDRPYVGGAGLPYSVGCASGREVLRAYVLKRLSVLGSPTCVMFRSDFVRGRKDFFELDSPVEDIQACFDVLMKGNLGFVHQVLAFNRRQRGSIWWEASQYDSFALNSVILLSRHGHGLFEGEEFARVERMVNRGHCESLARGIVEGRGRRFVEYHAQGLRSIDRRIEWMCVLRRVPRVLLDLLGNPKQTLGRVLRRVGALRR